MPIVTRQEWNDFYQQSGTSSLLQHPAWGDLKSGFGWTPQYVIAGKAGAMVLFRTLPLGFTIGYIPRGPIGTDIAPLWDEVHALCRARHAVFLRVEPHDWEDSPEAAALIGSMQGFRPAFATVQPPRTILIPLEGSEEDILKRMNEKTRYNIRLSQRKDLVFRQTTDAKTFHELMIQTGSRDDFGVHSEAYYQKCLDCFLPTGQVRILQAEYNDQPIAAIMLFIQGDRGYYLYGASAAVERNRMPNHLLQWQAIRICREAGCTAYDLWGIPDEPEEVLEAQFQERHDGLWQVYRFKRGFGGEVKRTPGSLDYVYNAPLYSLLKAYDNRRRKKAA